mgnify:CR=1 FL=1
MDNNKRNDLRLGIDDILSDKNLPDEIIIPNDNTTTLPDKIKSNRYVELKDKASQRAKKTLDSLLKFYLSEHIITGEEYVEARASLQHFELSKLIYMMETSEIAITTIMENIDAGDVQPRIFEVLAALQKTLLDVIKAQTMYMVAAEENVKRIARDIDIYKPDASANLTKGKSSDDSSGNKVSVRGQKDLMKAIAESNKRLKGDLNDEESNSNIINSQAIKPEPIDELDNFDSGFDDEEFEEDLD